MEGEDEGEVLANRRNGEDDGFDVNQAFVTPSQNKTNTTRDK